MLLCCALGVVGVVTTACGDCISLGYPSAMLSAEDAVTHASVSLAGATISETSNGRQPTTYTLNASTTAYTICCATGALHIQVTLSGYAPMDTTVDIESRGRCGIPEARTVVLQLRRTPM